jgi:glucose/arabinose dehydrogenase
MIQLSSSAIVTGLDQPLFVTTAPGDTKRLFIVERRTGEIKIFDWETHTLLSTSFLKIDPDELLNQGFEQGLLGLAFHPDYADNGKFYVNYTAPGGGNAGRTKIVEYRVSNNPNLADPATARTLLTFNQPAQNHNGGWMDFDTDGYLYIASGDGGGSGFQPGIPSFSDNSQDITDNLLGKILRIDVDTDAFPGNANRNYAIPDGNPFGNEIWVYGLRNPWRSSFDRLTGDLYIADVGQNTWEEINFQSHTSLGGENYGWNLREGILNNVNNLPPNLVDPIDLYNHSVGQSVIGGYVYRGAVSELQGTYFYGDFSSDKIWSFRYDGTTIQDKRDRTAELTPDTGKITSISSFGQDTAGNLYIVSLAGTIYRIEVTRTSLARTEIFDYARLAESGFAGAIDYTPVTLGNLPSDRLYDEAYYLNLYPDIKAAVDSGVLRSGYEHFINFGQYEGRNPSILYNEAFYLEQNSDVARGVANRQIGSGFGHYLAFGQHEGRSPSEPFNEQIYLANHPDVADAVTNGGLQSGFEHYLKYGSDEGRLPELSLREYPDIAEAVNLGFYANGFQHYLRFGQTERRNPSSLFNENEYLSQYSDVAGAVNSGIFTSGFAHYILFGRAEGR